MINPYETRVVVSNVTEGRLISRGEHIGPIETHAGFSISKKMDWKPETRPEETYAISDTTEDEEKEIYKQRLYKHL